MTPATRLWVGLVIACFCLPTSAPADDWPQFLGPQRNGVSIETGLVEELPKSGPPVVWRRPVGGGYSGPAVVGKRLVLFHQPAGDAIVECIDVEIGKTLWKTGYTSNYQDRYGAGPGPRATPTIVGDHVYTIGAESTLQCLELSSGKVIWRRELAKEYKLPDGFFGVSSSPVVEGDLLLVNLGAPRGGGLAGFDRKTGKTVWTSTNDTASYASPVVAAVNGQRLAFFFARTGLHCVEPLTGKERFFFRFRSQMDASVNAATPVVDGDRVFVSSEYGVGAALLKVKPDGYEQVWGGEEILSNHYNTSVLHEGYLYGIDGRQEFGARLRCVEFATGKPAWTEEAFGCASILLVEGKLLILGEKGTLTIAAASPDSFKKLGSASILQATCRAIPALADGQLYARNDEELIRVDLRKK